MGPQQYLPFDPLRTDYVTEPAAMERLTEASPLLWHAITYLWEDLQHSRRDDPRFRFFSEGDTAWWMHSQIRQFAPTLCEDQPELGLSAHTTNDHQFYLRLCGDLILVFKKLKRVYSRKQMREVLVRSNYPTRHNREFWAQRHEAGLDAPRLIVGYEPTKAMSEVRIHVGYPRTKGYQFDWIYEMPNQFEAANRLFKLAAPPEEAAERRGFTVVPRPDQADERGTA